MGWEGFNAQFHPEAYRDQQPSSPNYAEGRRAEARGRRRPRRRLTFSWLWRDSRQVSAWTVPFAARAWL
jgi:hypothetical protein